MRAWRRALAAVLAAGLLGAAGVSCPSRALVVQISTEGGATLVTACEALRHACDDEGACTEDPVLCDQSTCDGGAPALKDACTTDAGTVWRADQPLGVELMVVQESGGVLTVQGVVTPCFSLDLRPCILDGSGTNGCAHLVDPLDPDVDAGADPNGTFAAMCIRDSLQIAVQAAMKGGLTFPGFDSTDGIALVAAFYQLPVPKPVTPADRLSWCEEDTTGQGLPAGSCTPDELVAAAGFGTLFGSSTYDIACVSCQDTLHRASGQDTGPCPDVPGGECFLRLVSDVLP